MVDLARQSQDTTVDELFADDQTSYVLEVTYPGEFVEENWSFQITWIQDGEKFTMPPSFCDDQFMAGR